MPDDDTTGETIHVVARMTAYGAVEAHLEGEDDTLTKIVHELAPRPAYTASALISLAQACGTLAELWGRAIGEEPTKAWNAYVNAIAPAEGAKR